MQDGAYQSYTQGATVPPNQVNQAQTVANGETQNSAPVVPTMFVPNMGIESNMGHEQANTNNMASSQEQGYYPEGNQAIPFAQPETAGLSDQYNMTSEQVPPPGNYSYGPTSDGLPTASYSYDNVTQAVPSSVGYEDTGIPRRSFELYESESFEHLLREKPNGQNVDQVETAGTSTSENHFDYNFRVSLIGHVSTKYYS